MESGHTPKQLRVILASEAKTCRRLHQCRTSSERDKAQAIIAAAMKRCGMTALKPQSSAKDKPRDTNGARSAQTKPPASPSPPPQTPAQDGQNGRRDAPPPKNQDTDSKQGSRRPNKPQRPTTEEPAAKSTFALIPEDWPTQMPPRPEWMADTPGVYLTESTQEVVRWGHQCKFSREPVLAISPARPALEGYPTKKKVIRFCESCPGKPDRIVFMDAFITQLTYAAIPAYTSKDEIVVTCSRTTVVVRGHIPQDKVGDELLQKLTSKKKGVPTAALAELLPARARPHLVDVWGVKKNDNDCYTFSSRVTLEKLEPFLAVSGSGCIWIDTPAGYPDKDSVRVTWLKTRDPDDDGAPPMPMDRKSIDDLLKQFPGHLGLVRGRSGDLAVRAHETMTQSIRTHLGQQSAKLYRLTGLPTSFEVADVRDMLSQISWNEASTRQNPSQQLLDAWHDLAPPQSEGARLLDTDVHRPLPERAWPGALALLAWASATESNITVHTTTGAVLEYTYGMDAACCYHLAYNGVHYRPFKRHSQATHDPDSARPCQRTSTRTGNGPRNKLLSMNLRKMEAIAAAQDWTKDPGDGTCDGPGEQAHDREYLDVWFANINSFAAHLDGVMELATMGADIIGLGEHCIAASDVETTTAKLKDHSWSSYWRSGRVDAAGRTTGGVGLLLRAGLTFVPTPHHLLTEFEALGRVMTGWILRNGKPCFHLMVLYCVSDPHIAQNADLSSRMLRALEEWHSIHRGQKVCVVGDLNMTMSEDPRLASWTITGHYLDAMETFKPGDHREATHVAGRDIDQLLVSAALSPALVRAAPDDTWRFPSHRAIMCRLALPAILGQTQSTGVSLRVPQTLPTKAAIKKALANTDSDIGKAELLSALEAADVDASLRAWSWRWERLTLMTAEANGIETSDLMEGRGLSDTFEEQETVPQPHTTPASANRPIQIRQLRRSLGLARTWLHQSTRDIAWTEVEEYNRKEAYILRRLWNLHEIDHAFISQVTVDELAQLLSKKTQEHDRMRIAKWRSEMMDLGTACRYVRGAVAQRTTVISAMDDSLAIGYDQMNECLTAFWTQVAQPTRTTVQAVTDYVVARASTWPAQQEVPMVPFTADILSRLISKTRKRTAPGPGSWRAKELAQLPPSALHELAEVMNLVLRTGQTPKLWRTSWTSFLKKGATTRVDTLRPITVTALTWRLFAKHVYNVVSPKVEENLHPAQCGARPGYSSVTAALGAKRFADRCSHDKCAGFALQIDLIKCFNNLSATDGVLLLSRLGCPAHVCQLLHLHYKAMATRNKLSAVWAGAEYRTIRGCAQGCPLSTLLANVILRLLVPTSTSDVECCMYLDDIMLMSRSRPALIAAASEITATLQHMGLELNASKSVFTGLGCLKATDRADIVIGELTLPMSYRTDLLGFDLHSEAVQDETPAQKKRGGTAFTRLSRIAKLPGGALHKQKLVGLMVASLWQWAPLGQRPHASARASLRRRVTAVLNGPKFPRAQSHEILYGAVLKGHLLDPAWVQMHATVVLAWKMLKADLSAQVLLEVPPPPGSLLHDLDDMLRSLGMWRDGSHIHGRNSDFDFMHFDTAGALAHTAREHFRTHMFANVEARRPKEFAGLHLGINREWLHRFHSSLKDPLQISIFKRFITGSFLCRERQHRHSGGRLNPYCMVCPGLEIETVSHITASCVRHSFAYHRSYLDALSPQSAEMLSKHGLPLLTEDVIAAGYDSYACFLRSTMAALLQRDVDNSHIVLPDLPHEDYKPPTEIVRRRLRGKQPPPPLKLIYPLIVRPDVPRRRLRGKQPRPRAYALRPKDLTQPRVRKASGTAKFLESIHFQEDGLWRVNGHAIQVEGEGDTATLTCTLCQRRKQWKWRHLWSLSHCAGSKHQRKPRAKTCLAWHRRPRHIIIDELTNRLTCIACSATCSQKHLERFVIRHTKCE
eukprot:6466583-Amphidinium_carterae.1